MSARQLNRLAKAKGRGIDPLLSGGFNEEHVEESEEESEEEPKLALVSAAAVSDSDCLDNQYTCTSCRQRNTPAQLPSLTHIIWLLECHPILQPLHYFECFGAFAACCVFMLMSRASPGLILFRNDIL